MLMLGTNKGNTQVSSQFYHGTRSSRDVSSHYCTRLVCSPADKWSCTVLAMRLLEEWPRWKKLDFSSNDYLVINGNAMINQVIMDWHELTMNWYRQVSKSIHNHLYHTLLKTHCVLLLIKEFFPPAAMNSQSITRVNCIIYMLALYYSSQLIS